MANGWAGGDYVQDESAKPDWPALKRSYARLGYEQRDVGAPAVKNLIEALTETRAPGCVLFAGFDVLEADETFAWFAGRRAFRQYDFFWHLLDSSAVREALPQLQVPQPLSRGGFKFEETTLASLTLDGELAQSIVFGGCHERFAGTPAEAKRLGISFVEALVGERHGDFTVVHSREPWSPFFTDEGADETWLMIDSRQAVVYVLCFTDWA